MSNNSDMVRMLRLVEGQQFAGEPAQKPGDQVRGTDQAAKNGRQHPFHNRLVGEELSLEDRLAKKYQDMKGLHGKEEKEKDELEKKVVEGSLNELSVSTLSSYGKKAEKSNDKKLDKAAGHSEKATNLYSKGTASAVDKSYDHEDEVHKLHKQVNKRDANMDRAAGKLKNKMSKGVAEAFPNPGSGSTGSSKEDKRIAAALRKKHIPTTPNDKKEKGVAEADSPAQLDEFLPALAAGAGALARGAAAAGGAAIKGAQAVGGAIKQGMQSLAPGVASGARAAGRAISKVPAAAEKKVIQGAEVLNALVPGGIFNPDGSVKGSQYLTKYLTPQQIQQAQQQGVTEGSGPKEKQKTPYRDINGPGYKAAADKQLTKMSKDKAAEPGKKLADKIKQKNVSEGYDDHNPVVSAISRRVMHQRLDLLQKYGVTKVMSAIDEVADFVGDVEEIGTSDVSGWVRHVERTLGNMGELAETDVPPVAGAVPGAVPPAGTAPATTATGAAPAQNPADIMKQKNDQRKAVQDQIAATTKQLADLRTQLSSIQ